MKRSFLCTAVYIAICAVALTIPTRSATAQQLPPLPIQLIPDNIQNPGRPGGRRRGGGSRGECLSEGIPLSAIAYANSQVVSELGITRTDETVGMLTTQARPVLWFYLPSELTDNTVTTFVLKNDQAEILYQGQLSGETDSNGIVGLPIATDLDVGSAYHWFLTLDCEDGEQTMVDGWIERKSISAELNKRFEQLGDRNRAALYANYGFLQDALTTLARLTLEQPENEAIAQDWESFLNALDLSDLTTARLIDCCQLATRPTAAEAPTETSDIPDPDPDPEEEIAPEAEIPKEKVPATQQDTRTILQRARDRG